MWFCSRTIPVFNLHILIHHSLSFDKQFAQPSQPLKIVALDRLGGVMTVIGMSRDTEEFLVLHQNLTISLNSKSMIDRNQRTLDTPPPNGHHGRREH